MEGFTPYSDADRELDDLRRRAYGRHPDIGVDPAALERLRELEAAHRADARDRADTTTGVGAAGAVVTPPTPPRAAFPQDQSAPAPAGEAAAVPPERDGRTRSLLHRATATRKSRLVWGAGALVVVGGIVVTVLFFAPRADATLHWTATEPDRQVRRLVITEVPWLEIDTSTLRSFGSFLGLEIWSGRNAFDSPCLVAVHRANDALSESRCAPPAADLIMDVSSSGDGFEGFEGRPGDRIIRFILRGDTVDAYVYALPDAD